MWGGEVFELPPFFIFEVEEVRRGGLFVCVWDFEEGV